MGGFSHHFTQRKRSYELIDQASFTRLWADGRNDFRGCRFIGVRFTLDHIGICVQGASFDAVVGFEALTRCTSAFDECVLRGFNLSGFDLRRINFSRADLEHVRLCSALLEGAIFEGTNLSGADLYGAAASRTNFSKSRLLKAGLNYGDFTNSNFAETNAEGAAFVGATLIETNFYNANLKGATFQSADLKAAHLNQADLSSTNFTDADLSKTNYHQAKARVKPTLVGARLP